MEQILREIVDGIGKVADLIEGVSGATTEQADGIDQVNQAVTQMDSVTQSNAAGARESAEASTQLSHQAEVLRGAVDVLVNMVGGSGCAEDGTCRISTTGQAPTEDA